MYLGIDLGTSAVKALLVDASQRVVGQASTPLGVGRPRPLWSEQDPEAWWRATLDAVDRLREGHPRELAAARAVGLSGQMHGATLLGAGDRVLRPAILWNDGRSGDACAELERRAPELRAITGNLAMPGFTAPKLVWLARHEPEVFAGVERVLLPKDYLRLRLSGEYASDLSDASGTLWLDTGARRWSEELLEACGLTLAAMPRLVEGCEASGVLRPELAASWGMGRGVVVAGGAGDQAAGGVGAGVTEPGRAFLALGTSGVYFVADAAFAPNPRRGVHAFCHALPRRWHRMAVILSAASSLAWLARLLGARDEAELLAEVEQAGLAPSGVLFLPYLSGERTPHNDPHATGVFVGLTHATGRADLARAVLEGVAFALADGQTALEEASGGDARAVERVAVIGGGARSRLWGRILAAVLGRPLSYAEGAETGPAFGAARLARLAASGEAAEAVCTPPPITHVVEPEADLCDRYAAERERFRGLYAALRASFREAGARRTGP